MDNRSNDSEEWIDEDAAPLEDNPGLPEVNELNIEQFKKIVDDDKIAEFDKNIKDLHTSCNSAIIGSRGYKFNDDDWKGSDPAGYPSLFAESVRSILRSTFTDSIPYITAFREFSHGAGLQFIADNLDKVKILMSNKGFTLNKRPESNATTEKYKKYQSQNYNIWKDDVGGNYSTEIITYKNGYKIEEQLNVVLLSLEYNNVSYLVYKSGNEFIFYSNDPLSSVDYNSILELLAPYCMKTWDEKQAKMSYIFADANGNLHTKEFKIMDCSIDIDLQYNDDFKLHHEKIVSNLTTGDKGLVILSGQMGAGKTYYIRWLTKNINKKFIYVPRYFYNGLSSTSFMRFMMDYCVDSIFIFEDAEELIKSRNSEGSNFAISDILEMTDGLLVDILKAQIILTFNTDVKNIDSALLRPGRLIDRYDFGKLATDKANRLAEKLGKEAVYGSPATLAEIYNSESMPLNKEVVKKPFGFN